MDVNTHTHVTTTSQLIVMSKEPREKESSNTIEKLPITNDLEKNGENTETPLFKPKILCVIDRIKEKIKCPNIDSFYDYLSKMESLTLKKFQLS